MKTLMSSDREGIDDDFDQSCRGWVAGNVGGRVFNVAVEARD